MFDENTNTISWEALEFKPYTKNTGWYAGLVTVAVILIGLSIWRKDIFGAVSLMVIAGIVFYLFNKEPKAIKITLAPTGIYQGESFLPYKAIRNFWLVESVHQTLNLETTAYLNRIQVIELGNQDGEEVREYLLQYLTEHETGEETFAQQVMHRFKL